MLHITNGSSVSLGAAGIGGEVLYWQDVLHEGPAPLLPLEEFSTVRADFIARSMGLAADGIRAEFQQRDTALRNFRDHDEVVLWFEHDLYDQLQLIQVLDYLGRQQRGSTFVSLIQAGTYLGPMKPAALAALFPTRRLVSQDQFDLATRAWTAFRSPEPRGLLGLLESNQASLPYLSAAMRRHLEQFPSTRDGLNRTERQILRSVENGASTIADAFQADQRFEEAIFMGDDWFAQYVRGLSLCTHPLLDASANGQVMQTTIRMTSTGDRVLAAKADFIELNGIDRWLGGIHLMDAATAYRWDGATLVQ